MKGLHKVGQVTAEEERAITVEFLQLVNASASHRDLVQAATGFFQARLGAEAVGLRLCQDGDYPYSETRGFPAKFVQLEKTLCLYDRRGARQRDPNGKVALACLCGSVLSRKNGFLKPFLTPGGSFFSNRLGQFVRSLPVAVQRGLRGRCVRAGYQSLALIPLRAGHGCLGLLQLNHRQPDRFTAEGIELGERLAHQLALALAKFSAEEALQESESRLRAVFDNAPFEFWVRDREGRCILENRVAVAHWGSRMGRRAEETPVSPETLSIWQDNNRRAFAGEVVQGELEYEYRGQRRFFESIVAPFRVGHEIRGILGFNLDITNLKRAEAALRRSRDELETRVRQRTAELERANRSLAESEEKYRRLFETILDAVLVFDAKTGRILGVNDAAAQLYGYTRDEFLRLHHEAITAEPAGEDLPIRGLRAGQAIRIPLWHHRRKDGTVFPVEISASKFALGKQHLVCGIIRDITARCRMELRDAAFLALEQHLNVASTLEEAGRIITRVADRLLGWDACVVDLYSEASDSLSRVLLYDTIHGRKVEVDGGGDLALGPVCRRVLRRGGWLILRKPGQPGPAGLVPFGDESRPSASLMFVPLRIGQRPVGMLSVQSYTPNAYTREDLLTLQMLADQCSGAIVRIQAQEALLRANRMLRAIRECQETLLRATSEVELLRAICRIIVHSGGERMVWVGYAEQDANKTVRLAAKAGVDEGYVRRARITWADRPRGRGPTGTAIRTNQASLCRDTLTEPRFAPWRQQALKRGYRSLLALPLSVQEKCLGAITIYAPQPDAFDAEEQRLLTGLANDMALGITALRLRAEREQLQRRLLEISEREQQRIARDLHDGVCQQLAGAGCMASLLGERLASRQQPEARTAERIAEILTAAGRDARQLSHGLHPVESSPAGLMDGLGRMAAALSERFRIHCRFRCVPPVLLRDNAVATHLFRIAQEAVSNAIRHGRARRVLITLRQDRGRITLAVRDWGRGLPSKLPAPGGMGLQIMSCRAAMIGGSLRLRPAAGGGTLVTCSLAPARRSSQPR